MIERILPPYCRNASLLRLAALLCIFFPLIHSPLVALEEHKQQSKQQSSPLNKQSGQSEEIELKYLSFEEFRRQLRQNLPAFRQNRLSVEKSKTRVESARGAFDTTLNASWQKFQQKQYQIGSTIEMDYARGQSALLGVSQTIAQTGTRVSSSLNYSDTKITGSDQTGRVLSIEQVKPALSVEISQPILYNAFGLLDRYARNDARMQLEIDRLKKQNSDKSLENYYSKLFYQWHAYTSMLLITRQAIANARSLEAQSIRMRRARLADNDDVQKARASRLQYENQYQQYLINLQRVKNELREVVSIDNYRPDQSHLSRIFSSSLERSYPYVNFADTLDHRILQKSFEKLKYSLKVQKNRLLPRLDLVGSVTQKSNEESPASAFEKLNDTEYYAGFQVSYPLGNHEVRAAVKEAQLLVEELKLSMESTEKDYRTQVNNLIIAARIYKQQYNIYENKLKALRSQLATEEVKYRQARLNLSYVINTRNSIQQVELEILNLQVLMVQAALDYDALIK